MTPDEEYDELREPDYVLAKVKHPIIALLSTLAGTALFIWAFTDISANAQPDETYWWSIARILVGFVLVVIVAGGLTATGPRKIYNTQKEEALPERLHE